MSQPARSSVRFMCALAVLSNPTAAGSLKDDEVEVVTLGALQPPLVSQVRPPGSGRAEEPLDREESPDRLVARILQSMFERESQQLRDLEDHNNEMPPDSAPTTAAAAAAAAATAPASAEAQRTIRTSGSRVFLEEEEEGEEKKHIPGSVDAAEVGHERHDQQQQQQQDKAGFGTSSTSGVDAPPQELVGTVSNRDYDKWRVETEAGASNSAWVVDRVEEDIVRDAPDRDGEETSGGASTAARRAGDATARGALEEDPEESSVEGEARYVRWQETPDDPAAVAAESGAEGALREMSFGRSTDDESEAADSFKGGGERVADPGAFAELEEDGGVAREQDAAAATAAAAAAAADAAADADVDAAAGVETGGAQTGTDTGVKEGGTGSGGGCGTAAHAVVLDSKVGERVVVEGELEGGPVTADSNLSHGTSPTTIPGVHERVVVVEEGDEIETDDASTSTAKAVAGTEAAAEAKSIDEAGAVPGIEFVAGSVELFEEAQALLSDIVDEKMGGAAIDNLPFGEVSSLGFADDQKSERATKEDPVPAAGITPAVVSAESRLTEEQDSAEPGEGASVLEPPGDLGPVLDAGSLLRNGDSDYVAPGAGEKGEVGLGHQQLATNAASRESPAVEGSEAEFRPPEVRHAAPTVEATDNDGLVELPVPNKPRTVQHVVSEAPQADNEAAAEGEVSVEEPPRPRPVFRFPEPLSPGPDVNLGLAEKITADLIRVRENDDETFGFPPLPPIDAMPGSGAKNDGAGEAEGSGWWAAWREKLMKAAREKMARWASGAADRGGVLANKLMEGLKARVTKSWHETIEPQTEYARRRFDGVVDFCAAEVADHLSDPVLAEAL